MREFKRIIYAIAALGAAAMLGACNPDEPEVDPGTQTEPAPEPVTMTLSFVLPSDGLKTAWTAGDQIVVHGEYAATQVTVTLSASDISADGKTAKLQVEGLYPYEREDCATTLYAAYPASLVDNLRHCFFYTKFSTTNGQLMAACNDGDTFRFQDICSLLSFSVSGDYEAYQVSGIKKTVLGYEFLQVKLTDKEQNFLQYKGDPIQIVTAPFASGVNVVGIPGDVTLTDGLSVKLRKGGKAVKAFFLKEEVALQRGQTLDLGDITSRLEDYDDPLSDDIVSLDTDGSANCYIVTAPGAYKFKAVKGNSKQEFDDPFAASVLWETWNSDEEVEAGSVVASASYAEDYIILHTPAALRPGNAVIALRDAGGTILWSWHIWVPAEAVTADSCGDIMGAPLMNLNLGALVAARAEDAMVDPLSYGLVYQWGRKDPFVNSPTAMTNAIATWAGADEEVAAGQISLAASIENPRLLGHLNDGNWMDEVDDELWSDDEKTVYDPCPPGYRVPARNTTKVFWSGDVSTAAGWQVDGTNGWIALGEPQAVFPIAGYRDDWSVGGMYKVGLRALYWTSHGAEAKAYGADLRADGKSYKLASPAKSRLGSVRCVAE